MENFDNFKCHTIFDHVLIKHEKKNPKIYQEPRRQNRKQKQEVYQINITIPLSCPKISEYKLLKPNTFKKYHETELTLYEK